MIGITPDEIDRLLNYLPILVRDWERRFCISLRGRAIRGPVKLSAKQVKILQRIVSDFQAREMRMV